VRIRSKITEAFPWSEAPRYLIRDQDGIYGAAVTRRLRAMGIRDKPIAPSSPWQNPSKLEELAGETGASVFSADASQPAAVAPTVRGSRGAPGRTGCCGL